jgi:hypothetical protein
MRWWLAVLVLAMACGAVVAAPPVDDAPLRGPLLEEAKRRLASPDSKVRAWGCYVVSRYEVEEAVPLVREVLRREARRKKPDQWLVHAGLEALIRLRVHVSNEELTPFVGHPRQLLMLALRDPAHYADTLFLIHDPQGGLDLWIATGQHLMEVRDRRFLLRTLRELESTIVVRVTSGGSWRGPAGTICYDGRCPKPEGYPPLTFYHLTDRPWEGDIRVSGGRWPIYARPVRSGGGFGGSGGGSPRRNEVRAAWLNHLAGREGVSPNVVGRGIEFVRWAGRRPLLASVRAIQASAMRGYWEAVDRFVTNGWLTVEEARSLRPRLRIELEDRRPGKHKPLPAPPEPEVRNPWWPRKERAPELGRDEGPEEEARRCG